MWNLETIVHDGSVPVAQELCSNRVFYNIVFLSVLNTEVARKLRRSRGLSLLVRELATDE